MIRVLAFAVCVLLAVPALAQETIDLELVKSATDMFTMNEKARAEAIDKLAARNKPDIAAPLIDLMPFVPQDSSHIRDILRRLTGANLKAEWFEWMLWQEAHPQIRPFAGYDAVKARFLGQIDLDFLRFVYPGVPSDVRLEEIAWSGQKSGAIPALSQPQFIAAAEADWLQDDSLVLGISIGGDARTYPLRIVQFHEVVNDTVGGVPVTLSFCVLCFSAVLYESRPQGRVLPFEFAASGLVYRSTNLIYDHQSESLWSPLDGKPLVGKLVGSGIELKARPMEFTTWKTWHDAHPDTRVLAMETGYQRDYQNGDPYIGYFLAKEMLFPAVMKDWSHQPKELVFGVRIDGSANSWALKDFTGRKIVNDRVGAVPVVLIGDNASKDVRAYRRGTREFAAGVNAQEILAGKEKWRVTEEALLGPGGEKLERLPGTLAFWFAWQSRFPAAK